MFKANPYYSPEKCGLNVIEMHERNISYEFDMVVLWEDVKTKKRYWAQDSGCSCPFPFENFHSVADMQEWSLTKNEYKKAVAWRK